MLDRPKLQTIGYAVGAFVVVFIALHSLGGGGHASKVSVDSAAAPPPSGPPPGTGGLGSAGRATPGGGIVVDVAGEVARPGVYTLARGARAGDAIERAGGLIRRADPVAVNLAAPLQDGQQIVVPRRGAGGTTTAGTGAGGGPGGAAPGAGGAGGAPGRPVSLSTATVDQLDSLDGIGPTLAQRIVAYRDAHGGFRSVDELQQVPGIGDKRFAALRKLVQP